MLRWEHYYIVARHERPADRLELIHLGGRTAHGHADVHGTLECSGCMARPEHDGDDLELFGGL